jgi:hypothetical protein
MLRIAQPGHQVQEVVELVHDKSWSWKLEAGSWKLEAGSWKLEAGSWKLEAGSWKLEANVRGSDSHRSSFFFQLQASSL